MPIEYARGGVLAEHAAVRSAVGLFDVSPLGTATVPGPRAAAFVDSCLTNDLSRIGPRPAPYTLCCLPAGDPRAGGVVDDLIVYLHADDDVLHVPNAANAAEVRRRLVDEAPAEDQLLVADDRDGRRRGRVDGVREVEGRRDADARVCRSLRRRQGDDLVLVPLVGLAARLVLQPLVDLRVRHDVGAGLVADAVLRIARGGREDVEDARGQISGRADERLGEVVQHFR